MATVTAILAIDVGSSSIRCTAYEYQGARCLDGRVADCELDYSTAQLSSSQPRVTAMEGINHKISMPTIVPNKGHIRIQEVLSAIDECIDEVLSLLRQEEREEEKLGESSYQVVAIGFSTFVTSLVAVDICGDPVGESATLSYACNREDVVKECQILRDKLGPEKLHAMHQRTGAPLHPSYALPQLLAFYRNEENRAIASRIDKWKSISSICLHRWSGKLQLQMPISYSEASWTGMLNFRECYWDEEAAEIFQTCEGVCQYVYDEFNEDEIDLLPPLVDYDAALPFLIKGIPPHKGDGSVNDYWDRWPELRSSRVSLFLGVGDGAAANVGSKCGGFPTTGLDSHRIAVTVGTSAACRFVLPLTMHEPAHPPFRDISVPPGLFCYRIHRHQVLVGGALTDGGSVVEWARSLLNLHSDESFDACLEKVSEMYESHCTSPESSSPSGVTMIPFLSGERSTGFRGGAQGCISGMTRETTPAHIMYACLESVILRLGCVMKLVNEAGCSQFPEGQSATQGILVASGNALQQSSLWRQMLADCTSMDVVIDGDSSSEGTSRGVAMMVAGSLYQRELGCPLKTRNFEEPLLIVHKTEANAAAEEHWRTALTTQESLIDAVAPTWTNA
eukprot:CAMPEP_0172536578 /NCGR_PEP_ID=MMETSP1067-20121228/8318_1 /TAXON_ID=265564 ORGANISM="Thalassiosira punctigera, Strain Tpunct2005C2" /NCGR_SAMPLE_ID=MMETSP1067 /ASSEMBLY_ACC=CAM_ASM_000444 /LENGTH=619 /DNA_ID=CAMNT_0013321683 /DNA_START=41 /DNA_END=1900 /DNA_ORIENTATION=-